MSLYSIDFDNSIDRAFDDFIKDLTVTRRSDDASRSKRVRFPTMDVHETENEFLVNAELPVCIYFNYSFKFKKKKIFFFTYYFNLKITII